MRKKRNYVKLEQQQTQGTVTCNKTQKLHEISLKVSLYSYRVTLLPPLYVYMSHINDNKILYAYSYTTLDTIDAGEGVE